MDTNRRKNIITVLLIVTVRLLPLLLIYAGCYTFAVLHTRKLANDLNNPIVDSHYKGWCKTQLDEKLEIKLPKEWRIQNCDGIITIADQSGETVAFGQKCTEAQAIEMLSEYYESQLRSYECDTFDFTSLGNLANIWWTICDFEKLGKVKIVSLALPYYHNDESYVYYLFFTENTEQRCHEAVAIAFSLTTP